MKHNLPLLFKLTGLAGLLLVALGGTGLAQVAVSDFLPATPTILGTGITPAADSSFTTRNPAAMAFGEPSRAGAGRITGNRTRVSDDTNFDLTGLHFGARWTDEEALTIAGETITLESDSSAFDYDEENTNVAVSFLATDELSVGAGLESAEVEQGFVTDDAQSTLVGVSFEFDSNWFGGAVIGREDFDRDNPAPTADVTADRGIVMYGLAYHDGEPGRSGWHLELNIEDRDDYDNQGQAFGGYRRTELVAQVLLGDFLLGYTSSSVELNETDEAIGAGSIDIGYLPNSDLSISFRVTSSETDDANGDKAFEDTYESVNVAYLF